MKDIAILAIDVQNDFCNPNGALSVPGAKQDSFRLSKLIDYKINEIGKIVVTLDSHSEFDIAHPVFWEDDNFKNPDPFTIISKQDVIDGKWKPSNGDDEYAIEYVTALEKNGKYPLCIWPPHCIVGTDGWSIEENIQYSLSNWSKQTLSPVRYYVKGLNPLTEHYSAFRAEVSFDSDPSTHYDFRLVHELMQFEQVLIAGQAQSHCVANSIYDMISQIDGTVGYGDIKDEIKRFVLLEDAMSNVPGFEDLGNKFFEDMSNMGMQIKTTKDYM